MTDFSFFFENVCYEGCPRDVSVEDEGICVPCSDNCKTCDSDYSPDFCTSCYGDSFLDYFTNRCVETCPVDITVANVAALTEMGQTRTCELCNDSCLTCSSDST